MLLPDNVPLIIVDPKVREADGGTSEEWCAVLNVKLTQIWWWCLLDPAGRAEIQKTSIPEWILRDVLTEINAAALMKVDGNAILKVKADATLRSALDVM